MKILITLCCFVALWSAPALAQDYQLSGTFAQGGLVMGQTHPEAQVTLAGKAVPVNPQGQFLLGFGRDAELKQLFIVTYPDGRKEQETLTLQDRDFKIQRIDGLPKSKVSPNPERVKRIKADNALVWQARTKRSETQAFLSGFQWPVTGRISGVFGSQRILNGKPRSMHKGVDVAAPAGTLITAAADGVISLTHDDMYLMGQTVMIDHGMGLQSIYIHMSDILVTDGQQVKKGDPVGKVGKSGRATGPHLHWGVSLGTLALDPELLVGPMP